MSRPAGKKTDKEVLSIIESRRLRNGIVGLTVAVASKVLTKDKMLNQMADYAITLIAGDLSRIKGLNQANIHSVTSKMEDNLRGKIDVKASGKKD